MIYDLKYRCGDFKELGVEWSGQYDFYEGLPAAWEREKR